MTKGEKILAEAMGCRIPNNDPVLVRNHPFLRKVVLFMQYRESWQGTVTELLRNMYDNLTSPNSVTKLLNKFEYDILYDDGIRFFQSRTNRKRILCLQNIRFKKSDGSGDGYNDSL